MSHMKDRGRTLLWNTNSNVDRFQMFGQIHIFVNVININDEHYRLLVCISAYYIYN